MSAKRFNVFVVYVNYYGLWNAQQSTKLRQPNTQIATIEWRICSIQRYDCIATNVRLNKQYHFVHSPKRSHANCDDSFTSGIWTIFASLHAVKAHSSYEIRFRFQRWIYQKHKSKYHKKREHERERRKESCRRCCLLFYPFNSHDIHLRAPICNVRRTTQFETNVCAQFSR